MLTQEAPLLSALRNAGDHLQLLQESFKDQFKGPLASSGFATFSNRRRKIDGSLIAG
jgi:hypothetical protein